LKGTTIKEDLREPREERKRENENLTVRRLLFSLLVARKNYSSRAPLSANSFYCKRTGFFTKVRNNFTRTVSVSIGIKQGESLVYRAQYRLAILNEIVKEAKGVSFSVQNRKQRSENNPLR